MTGDTGATPQLLDLQDKLDDVSREERRQVGFARARFASIRDALFDRRKELVMRVPYFWLRALIGHPALALFITDVDSRMLRRLVDVDVSPVHGSKHPRDFELVFTFAGNDYFKDDVLVKRFTHSEKSGRVVGVHDIAWKKGCGTDLVARKGRGGFGHSGFFRWIATDTLDISNLGDLIRDEVYPHAIELYFGTYSIA